MSAPAAPHPHRPSSRAGQTIRHLIALLLLSAAAGGGAALRTARAASPALSSSAGAIQEPAEAIGATADTIPGPADTIQAATDTSPAPADTTAPRRVLAYYFHTTKRCATCRKIEATTAEAIQTGFPEELKNGRLVFRAVNLDEPINKHFTKDYQLFTKSVVLVEERAGEQTAWKNLPRIWELIRDRERFVRYIQSETRAYLAGKPS